MAFNMFFLASPRCAAGEPVSLGCEAEGKPLVVRDGLRAMVNSFLNATRTATKPRGEKKRQSREKDGKIGRREKERPSSITGIVVKTSGATAETKEKLRNGGVSQLVCASRRQDSGAATTLSHSCISVAGGCWWRISAALLRI